LHPPASGPERIAHSIGINVGPLTLQGDLVVPAAARGVVLFAHGSGSGRHSPRNRFVAGALQQQGVATLLLDLLTEEEEAVDRETAHLRFDIGRPDLAGPYLPRVRASTLLVVGGADPVVLRLNEAALRQLGTRDKELVTVPGATHLFEEPGALEEVARLAADWFVGHFVPGE